MGEPRWLQLAKSVDWLNVAQRVGVLGRTLRGDSEAEIQAASARETLRAKQVANTIRTMAGAAVGCSRKPDCDCPICTEERG